MRHLGVAGRVPVHGVHTQPVRHIHRSVLRHHQAAAVLEEEAVQEAGVSNDTRRVARLAGHHVRPAVRMVSITRDRPDTFSNVRRKQRAVPGALVCRESGEIRRSAARPDRPSGVVPGCFGALAGRETDEAC